MTNSARFVVVSPADDSVVYEGSLATEAELDGVLSRAVKAQRAWGASPLAARVEAVLRFLSNVEAEKDDAARELMLQMGRPISQAPSELAGFLDRGRTMARLAEEALADYVPPAKDGFTRAIQRVPVGVVLVLAPWNYPWLTAVNAVVPALLAGNAVLLKHAEQTPLVAERMSASALRAGLPEGVLQHIHMSHELTANAVRDARVGAVAFTGSVEGGHAISRAAAGRFISVGYELGGKDAAYVCEDTDVAKAAANVMDGAMYNAGQSCCAVERVYVHEKVLDAFLEASVAEVRALRLGDPREAATNLGPLVRARNAAVVRAQLEQAYGAGARGLVGGSAERLPSQYVAPEVVVGVTQELDLMSAETFGPVVGVMPVGSDEEAVARINDSAYGLTASLWTPDLERAQQLAAQLDVGTVFMNRCDYLDPELAWVGVRDSGRGCTLSRFGFDGFTRLKSLHLRHAIP
ncbi:MAG: aldehyde dehydrogenase family protein [Polyangiales bacterium]